jgi:hypothetical protein
MGFEYHIRVLLADNGQGVHRDTLRRKTGVLSVMLPNTKPWQTVDGKNRAPGRAMRNNVLGVDHPVSQKKR